MKERLTSKKHNAGSRVHSIHMSALWSDPHYQDTRYKKTRGFPKAHIWNFTNCIKQQIEIIWKYSYVTTSANHLTLYLATVDNNGETEAYKCITLVIALDLFSIGNLWKHGYFLSGQPTNKGGIGISHTDREVECQIWLELCYL